VEGTFTVRVGAVVASGLRPYLFSISRHRRATGGRMARRVGPRAAVSAAAAEGGKSGVKHEELQGYGTRAWHRCGSWTRSGAT